MQSKELFERVSKMCDQPLKERGATLWDITFEKEGARFVLTVYIDKEGGVDIEDCEAVSRHIDPLLDAPEYNSLPNYVLSVSSAGLERHISKDEHFNWAMGKEIDVTFYKAIDGEKTITGILEQAEADKITIAGRNVEKSLIALARLHFEF